MKFSLKLRADRLVAPALTFAMLLASTGIAGCGGRGTYPVQGKVEFADGSPLTRGVVMFTPNDPGIQTHAKGDIHKDGTFHLGTYTESDGALPGRYKVVVIAPYLGGPRPPRKGLGEKAKRKPAEVDPALLDMYVDSRFADPDKSGLEFTVEPGKNDFTVKVSRPEKPPQNAPEKK